MLLGAGCDRSGVDGFRKLDIGAGIPAGGPSSLRVVRQPTAGGSRRATSYQVGRRALLRGDDVEVEGSRQLPRIQEEAEPGTKRKRAGVRGSSSERKGRKTWKGTAEVESEGGQWLASRSLRRREKGEEGDRGAVRVPGASASTVHGGIWDTCFSVVSRLRSGLSALFHSLLQASVGSNPASQGNVWPMPLPYPEAHVRRRGNMRDVQLKLAMNYVILVLNWLAMGEQLMKVDGLGLGTKLSANQWKVVHRIIPLVRAVVDHEVVDAVSMGRSAAKVETIEEALKALEEAVVQPAGELRRYERRKPFDAGPEWGQSGHPGEVVGVMRSNIDHVAKDVEPDRYKFHGRPSFDAARYLDDENKRRFERPLDFAEDIDPRDARLPQVRVRGSRENQMKLLETLDSSGRLKLLSSSQVQGGFENGLFSILKDTEKDRMVLDARRPNMREQAEEVDLQLRGRGPVAAHLPAGTRNLAHPRRRLEGLLPLFQGF